MKVSNYFCLFESEDRTYTNRDPKEATLHPTNTEKVSNKNILRKQKILSSYTCGFLLYGY